MEDLKDRITSRKFILALLAAVLVFFNRLLDLGLTDADMAKIMTMFGSFIVAEGLGDVVSRFR